MKPEDKQDLVDQRAVNGQTIVFIADRMAEIADQADNLAKQNAEFSAVAALEREHRKTLMEMAAEEKSLATAIQLGTRPEETLAAMEREHRKDLLEIARSEHRLAQEMLTLHPDDSRDTDDVAPATMEVIAEQAERNRALLRHVADTERNADRALRHRVDPTDADSPHWT